MQGSNRIPADKTRGFTSWKLPEVSDGRVVKAEAEPRRNARGEIVDVKKEEIVYSSLTAAQLEEITNQAYDDVRQQAYEEGSRQGRDEGYQAGLRAAQQQIDQQVAALCEAIDNVYQLLAGQDDAVEQALVNIAISMARSVLRRELSIDASHLREVVADAIALLPHESERIVVYLSQADYALMAQTQLPSSWQLRVDKTLSPGGCRIHNGQSVVDYSLEQQFQQTVDALVAERFKQLAATARDGRKPAADSEV